MSPPVWGCPWHGLITNGQLTLPNGQSMVWPAVMAGAMECQAGSTHLIRAQGVPAISRSTEEAAADTAAGRQWKTTALLSGAGMSLHGTVLDGWIYCAADGTRWHVPRAAFGGLTFGATTWGGIVPVRRFGVLGGAPDERPMPFALDPQQPVIEGLAAAVYIDVHAVSADGSRAILMAYVRESALRAEHGDEMKPCLQALPVGFYMVTLTGGADGLALSLAVLYGQDETLGTADSEYPETAPIDGHPGMTQVGPWSAYCRDRIVAAWFDGNNDAVPVKWSMEWSGAINNPAPSGSPATRTCTATTDMLWTLKAGATIIDTIAGHAEFELFQREPGEADGVAESRSTITVEGEPITASSSTSFVGNFGSGVGPWFMNSYGGESALGRLENAGWAMICADEGDRFWLVDIQRYSNNLLGLRLRKLVYSTSAVTIDYRRAGHPGGASGTTLTVAGHPENYAAGHLPYGSYNPDTGAIVRNQQDPVCWV